jgi:hypothetical protein
MSTGITNTKKNTLSAEITRNSDMMVTVITQFMILIYSANDNRGKLQQEKFW